MPKKGVFGDKTVYFCSDCGFGYLDEETAQKCEDWCTTNHSCSTDITKNAVSRV